MAVHPVDAYRADIFERLADCDGFMWRFDFSSPERGFAKRLLSAIEHTHAIASFPSWRDAWHFEDKIAQHYLLNAVGIPTPRTWTFWDRASALAFFQNTRYPLVLKIAHGCQSNNVRLIANVAEAEYWVHVFFGTGAGSLNEGPASATRQLLRRARSAIQTLSAAQATDEEIQRHCIYVQEFLAGNSFDTRVTVIGSRAFAFRRLNRPQDFRASGSGRIDWDPEGIDPRAVHLAFDVARRLGAQSVAVDVLRRSDELVVADVSYTYATWAVRDCPGHWERPAGILEADLVWTSGRTRPEDAIFHDFVARIAAPSADAIAAGVA
jgi:glutathione synthase/RimK-type ligase-like ATP-grasp enzyme